MRVLLIHDFYQIPGGEDQVYRSEGELLERNGNIVSRHLEHNRRVPELGLLKLAARTIWSRESYWAVRNLVRSTRPDVAHVHNTLPLISPAVYYALQEEGVPVVQTLHNYRLLCLPGVFFRDGRVCEDCQGKTVPWPGVLHACYRDSRFASTVVASMLTVHRALGTYAQTVDLYIALTKFGRDKLIEGGLSAEKIVIKPNFVDPDPGRGEGKGCFALFAARFSEGKGVRTLLAACERLEGRVPVTIVGAGPLAEEVRRAARRIPSIRFMGWQSRRRLMDLMKDASVFLFPSETYEGLGLVMIEAFASGLPIIASNLGSMSSVVDDGRTGLHFSPGDPVDLAQKILWIWDHPQELANMRGEARAEYEERYTAEKNYEMLMDIYHRAICSRSAQKAIHA